MGGTSQNTKAPVVPSGLRQEVEDIRSADNLSGKFLPMITKAAGIMTVAFSAFLGPVALLAAGAAMLGVEVYRAHKKNDADLNRELALYHRDIARVLGKPADAKLTLQDMYDAADEKKVGDKAIKPLKQELEHLNARGKYNMRVGVMNALITTAVTGALSLIMTGFKFDSVEAIARQGMQIFWTITGSLSISSMATYGAENIAHQRFEATKPESNYKDLVRLQQIAQVQNVSAEQVFATAVNIDKNLAADIEKRAGMPYSGLSHRNKLKLVERYESIVHAKALAEHINEGGSVTSVALLMHGQLDPATLPQVQQDAAKDHGQSQGQSQKREKSFETYVKNRRETTADAAAAGMTLNG